MTRTIYFLRHAKSSWHNSLEDKLRPLNKRGQRDAYMMSNYACKQLKRPDLIAISSCLRTQQTAEAFIKAFKLEESEIEISDSLHDFSGESVIKFIKTIDTSRQKVMLVGHNHAFTALVNMLGNKPIDHVPTCGLTVIDFECKHWRYIKRGCTIKTLFPRDFKL